jgi:C4-dicarboxylate-specific signal transduction histidine kinase
MNAYVSGAISTQGDSELEYSSTIGKLRDELASASDNAVEGQRSIAAAISAYDTAKSSITSKTPITTEMAENLDSIYQNIMETSKAYTQLVQERESLASKLDAIHFDFEKISERLQDLFELAGLGLSVEMFTHEFDASIRGIKTKNQKMIETGETGTVGSFIKHIHYISYSLDALRKQMSYFNPGLKYVRAEKQSFTITEFLNAHRSFFMQRCEAKNINFQLDITVDFEVRVNRGMLNQVFDNLFNNSEYWLGFAAENKIIESKNYHIDVPEHGIIVVWDNGVGISKDIETRLFEPFESKKPGGRGLGLYVAASNLRYSSARIRLLGERNSEGNLYRFEIDLSQISK